MLPLIEAMPIVTIEIEAPLFPTELADTVACCSQLGFVDQLGKIDEGGVVFHTLHITTWAAKVLDPSNTIMGFSRVSSIFSLLDDADDAV